MVATERATLILVIRGPIERADIPGLCRRAGSLTAAAEAQRVLCELDIDVAADAVTVDALARLLLTTKRMGAEMVLVRTKTDLKDLMDLIGLHEVLGEGP